MKGSGDHGRITRDDIMRAANDAPPRTLPPMTQEMRAAAEPKVVSRGGDAPAVQQLVNTVSAANAASQPVPGVGYGSFKVPPYREKPGDKIVPFTRRRRITADHMVYSKHVSPHVMTIAECDLFKAARLREANKDRYKKEA